jgi:putative CocE/NonD family hydrolase
MSCIRIEPRSTETGEECPVAFEFNAPVPTRDGETLLTDIYRPATGVYSAIVMRTPYDKRLTMRLLAREIAKRGFAVIVQSSRGRFGSSGSFRPFLGESEDNWDLLEWLSKQVWFDGRVGLLGWSYLAYTNYLMCGVEPPSGVRIAANVSCVEVWNPFNTFYPAGALSLHWALPWAFIVQGNDTTNLAATFEVNGFKVGWPEILKILPLTSVPEKLAVNLSFWNQWLDHTYYDYYWKKLNLASIISRTSVPTLHITGWYDYCVTDTIGAFVRMRCNSPNQALIVGPWDHENIFKVMFGEILPKNKGGRHPVEDGDYSLYERIIHWFDKWLKNDATVGSESSEVEVFVSRENRWYRDTKWPIRGLQWIKFYLSVDRMLVTDHPSDEGSDEYIYDPASPTPTIGGAVSRMGRHVVPGPLDQTLVEHSEGTLLYSTATLTAAVRVVGELQVVLFVSSDSPDTDFAVRLIDSDPNGREDIVQDGIVRARCRESVGRPTLLTPGEVYKLHISMGATAHLFGVGHRIRLLVSSSNFPKYDRNLNTGRRNAAESEYRVAKQTVFRGGIHASFVHLPVMQVPKSG